jgi:hypothetical protein
MSEWVGSIMRPPRLRFDPAIPSRAHHHPYQGLRQFGAYSLGDHPVGPTRLLLVYPQTHRQHAELLTERFFGGAGNYPGYARLFGLPAEFQPTIETLELPTLSTNLSQSAQIVRDQLAEWERSRQEDPVLAFVVHPHSDRWEVDSPYYAAKSFFGRLAIATQMVTQELLRDDRRLGWSLANIALASFAKLGGRPWVVDARGDDADIVVGVGRADVRSGGARRRIFGYAVAFISNGSYLDTASFPPAVDESEYQGRLTDAIHETLTQQLQIDQPPARVVIHLAKRTGRTEVEAAQSAIARAGYGTLPTAFLRVDDSSLYEFMDGGQATYAAPKGLAVRLGTRRALVQTEGASSLGPARRPLLIELDQRSGTDASELGRLTLQVFRLAHANWRGFNSRSKPVTLFYGEQLAELVGYLVEANEWDPATLKPELRRRPWFL